MEKNSEHDIIKNETHILTTKNIITIGRPKHFMVKLKNLKRCESTAECDIFSEDSKVSGHIVIDLASGSLREFTLPDGYEWCDNHAYHAARNLARLAKNENLPDEHLVAWY